jgi:DNA-binding IclR family transcriptional regulator
MARGGLSATRATEIIDFLASRGTTAFTLSELSRELDINVASCHAVLQALTKSGHLSRHPKHKTFTLGPALVAIGHIALKNHELIGRAEAAAAELSRSENVEVLLSMRAGDAVLGLAHFQRDRVSKSLLRAGQRVPLRVPYGATFVAWETDKEIDRWISRGFRDQVPSQQADELRLLLELIRKHKYQISLKLDDRVNLASMAANWEQVNYSREAAQRMAHVHDDLNRLFFDPLAAKEDEKHIVDFITAPLFDPHDRALYAMTLYNFDREMTPKEIQSCLSKMLSMCLAVSRNF